MISQESKRSKQPGSVHEIVKQKVCEIIESKKLKKGDRLPPVMLLAKQWDVNYRTMRSAFSALEKEGVVKYLPNQGVEVRKEVSVDCAISFIRWQGDSYCLGFSDGIEKFTQSKGLDYVLVDANRSHKRFIEAITHPAGDIKGVIVSPFELPEYKMALKEAIHNGVKVIFLDRFLEGFSISSVSVDHFACAYKATTHLIETHRRPVYYLGSVKEPSSCRQRLDGWANAMRDYNFCDIDSYIFEITATESELASSSDNGLFYDVEAAKSLLKSVKSPVSVLCCNDYIARGIYGAADEYGLQIGKDVFVVGFGNLPLCENFEIPLSSINQNSEIVGYEAAKMLYQSIQEPATRPVCRLIPGELVIRKSSV